MVAREHAPTHDDARTTARPRRPRRTHAGLFGGIALALLDLALYVTYALTARPAPCSAPQVTTPLLDCFWPTLGASLAALPWVYVGLTLAVPFVVTLLLVAARAAHAPDSTTGNPEPAVRGATVGGVVGLLGSLFEVVIVVGVVIYAASVAPAQPAEPSCLVAKAPPCVSDQAFPGLAELFLLVAATFAGIILLLRLTAGVALGALGGWLGARLPGQRQPSLRPTPAAPLADIPPHP